jgi:outer membrane immunogenic protein
MKALLRGMAGLCVFGIVSSAPAADLPVKSDAKTLAPAASSYDWSGFYVGANGGYASSSQCRDVVGIGAISVAPAREGCHDADGRIIGGQAGVRWQSGAWVFGVEAQGDWADLAGSDLGRLPTVIPVVNRTRVDALGLFGGEIGYSWNHVLPYLKGGAALTHDRYDDVNASRNVIFNGVFPGGVIDSAADTRWGGFVGVGVDYGFAPNWSAGIEYDHVMTGARSYAFIDTRGINAVTRRIDQDVDMITARLTFHFGGSVIQALY